MTSPLFSRNFPNVPEAHFGNKNTPRRIELSAIGSGGTQQHAAPAARGVHLTRLKHRREYLRESFPDSTAPAQPSMSHRILFATQIPATMISATDSPAIHASIVIIF